MAARKSPPAGKADGVAAVRAFLDALEHPQKAGIVRLRRIILGVDERIGEGIKWNAPSFFITEHFATFKVFPPKAIQLVLHTGAKPTGKPRTMKVPDPAGLLKWPAPDRCVLTLPTEKALVEHEAAVVAILRHWIAQLPG